METWILAKTGFFSYRSRFKRYEFCVQGHHVYVNKQHVYRKKIPLPVQNGDEIDNTIILIKPEILETGTT